MVARNSQVGKARRHDEVLARHEETLVHGHGISWTRRAHVHAPLSMPTQPAS